MPGKPTTSWTVSAEMQRHIRKAITGRDGDIVPTYYCKCSWLGGDPDERTVKGKVKRTCPACWHHDRRRVEVTTERPAPVATTEPRCPKCGKSDQLCVTETYTAMHPYNAKRQTATNALGATCPSEHFDDGSEDYGMCCRNCGREGTLTEFGADLKDWE